MGVHTACHRSLTTYMMQHFFPLQDSARRKDNGVKQKKWKGVTYWKRISLFRAFFSTLQAKEVCSADLSQWSSLQQASPSTILELKRTVAQILVQYGTRKRIMHARWGKDGGFQGQIQKGKQLPQTHPFSLT